MRATDSKPPYSFQRMAALLRRSLRSVVPRTVSGATRLCASTSKAPAFTLDGSLEKIISRFESSMKSGSAGVVQEKSSSLVDEFGQLQRFRVQRVLLVCSDYDSYTFEEDGCANLHPICGRF